MKNFKAAIGSIFIGVAFLSMSGCAAGGGDAGDFVPGDAESSHDYAEAQGWTDVASILSDGVVTAEENAAAHEAWKRCREESGFTFGPSSLDPINGKLYLETEEFRGGDDVDQAAHEQCYSRYSDTVEFVYQSTAPSAMDPSLIAHTQSCLDSAGYARPNMGSEARLKDFYAEGSQYEPGDQVYTCVEEGYLRLFPELPGLAYGFTLAD